MSPGESVSHLPPWVRYPPSHSVVHSISPDHTPPTTTFPQPNPTLPQLQFFATYPSFKKPRRWAGQNYALFRPKTTLNNISFPLSTTNLIITRSSTPVNYRPSTYFCVSSFTLFFTISHVTFLSNTFTLSASRSLSASVK